MTVTTTSSWEGMALDELETAIENAKWSRRGWVDVPGRPTIGTVRRYLEENGKQAPAAKVPTIETWQSWFDGWSKSADGEVLDLERGARCHRCRKEIETEADHTIAHVDENNALADFHKHCTPAAVRARIVR